MPTTTQPRTYRIILEYTDHSGGRYHPDEWEWSDVFDLIAPEDNESVRLLAIEEAGEHDLDAPHILPEDFTA